MTLMIVMIILIAINMFCRSCAGTPSAEGVDLLQIEKDVDLTLTNPSSSAFSLYNPFSSLNPKKLAKKNILFTPAVGVAGGLAATAGVAAAGAGGGGGAIAVGLGPLAVPPPGPTGDAARITAWLAYA